MRVSMVDPSLFTLPYDQGLAMGLAGAGHEVTIYGRRRGPDDNDVGGVPLVPEFYKLAGSRPVAALPRAIRLGIKGLDHIWSMARLLRRLRRERPDVIHFQWLPLPLVDRKMLGQFRKVAPLVLTVHDTNPFNGDPSVGLQARGVVDCFGAFGRLIVHTQQGMSRLTALGIPADRLVVLPHGPMLQDVGTGDADPMDGVLTFMLFGKIKPYKGVDTLIEAFARIPAALRAKSRVRIVGKSYMDLTPLHTLIQAHGLQDSVTIEPRFVVDSEIPELFGPGTVAMFPYRELEASGVLPQALGYGRPIVASRIGVFAETLQDGVHGHLAPPDDPEVLAKAMRHLIEDRGFAATCARNALALSAQSESWDTIARRTAVVYQAAGCVTAPTAMS